MARTEIEWEELLWDLKKRIRHTHDIIDGIHPSPEEVIKEYDKKNEEKKPTAAEVITLLESQEPMTVEKIQERSKKLRRKVFGDNV